MKKPRVQTIEYYDYTSIIRYIEWKYNIDTENFRHWIKYTYETSVNKIFTIYFLDELSAESDNEQPIKDILQIIYNEFRLDEMELLA